jgi:hypothetical protein
MCGQYFFNNGLGHEALFAKLVSGFSLLAFAALRLSIANLSL